MTKEEILEQLRKKVFVRLAPTTNGIGVVAIKDIPKGTDVFEGCMPNIEFVAVPKNEIDELEDGVKKLVTDFCPLQDGVYWLPSVGIQAIDKSYYLNHSSTPNMVTNDEGETFITIRDIKKGEELTVDYNTYDEQDDDYKK